MVKGDLSSPLASLPCSVGYSCIKHPSKATGTRLAPVLCEYLGSVKQRRGWNEGQIMYVRYRHGPASYIHRFTFKHMTTRRAKKEIQFTMPKCQFTLSSI
ncbi:hypothetical protein AVEN_246645-1 [Araneus ventricosus]|uniref:Uncharacterized protein n=1 Tax=Araneus ventricosus TaxID=182803 RepID=A0A4Y2UYR6_ARAVE|nr:hypothetical protein AVEN_246645-1 [Araneus ventricosus]